MPSERTTRNPRLRMNQLFDRWRGPVVVLGPLLIAFLTAMGFEVVYPSTKIAAVADSVAVLREDLTELSARYDTTTAVFERVLGSLNTRLCLDATGRERALMQLDCSAVQRAGGVLQP